ncbi:hypothetical protein A2U01_0104019, partial [Trifolium medium]|nr:hypothetical protein [Trifolium medium]
MTDDSPAACQIDRAEAQ